MALLWKCHVQGQHVLPRRTKTEPYKHIWFVLIFYLALEKKKVLRPPFLEFSVNLCTLSGLYGQEKPCHDSSPAWKHVYNPLTFRTRGKRWRARDTDIHPMAGKWISIYGFISLIMVHSPLSGLELTSLPDVRRYADRRLEMVWWPPICQTDDGCFADTIK